MRILLTSSRMPFAVDEIRKLGRRGHSVVAADTFRLAPGNHSSLAVDSLRLPPPRFDPRRFVEDLSAAAELHEIELLLPTFEEIFYLARHRSLLPDGCSLFAADFETLDLLHNKLCFVELADEIGLPTPPTIEARDADALRRATKRFDRWVARAVYSRGAVDVLTHEGAIAGDLSLEDCEPDDRNPWIVQPFVDGSRLCSYSLAREGRVTAHCTYEHPHTIEGGGGISFRSVESAESLSLVERLVERTGYTGQLGLDLIRSENGPVLIECNPRATDGVVLMTDEEFDSGLCPGTDDEPLLVPPGRERQISVGLLRELVFNFGDVLTSPGELRDALSQLVDVPSVYLSRDDPAPALALPLSYSHVFGYRLYERRNVRSRSSIMGAYLYDVSWNGDPIP
ncbi:MAG: ATP-grasp domain-containing protein [Polyangia bacterium]